MKNLHKKNVDYLIQQPFTIFEIKNFLPEDIYLTLYKNFPEDHSFGKSKEGNVISPKDPFYEEHINKNPVWKIFIEELNSEQFINNAFKFALIPSLKSRGIKALKKWTKKKFLFPFSKFFRKIDVEIHFTIQRMGEHLSPHTDAPTKLLSMIFYFPDENIDPVNSGTEFWISKKNHDLWKNWENKHINSEDELGKFKEDNEIFYKSMFEKNKLVGFVKNNVSWHSVLNNNNRGDQLRKALVINIREI